LPLLVFRLDWQHFLTLRVQSKQSQNDAETNQRKVLSSTAKGGYLVMKSDLLQDAFGEIKDVYIEEAHQTAKKQRNNRVIWGTLAACLAALVLGFGALMLVRRTPQNALNPTAANAGGTNGKINLQAACVLTGTENLLTNEEGYSFLQDNLAEIKTELLAFGATVDDELHLSANGYSHLRTGDDGNEMAVNVRDYLLYRDQELVCIATVVKETENLRYTLMFGAKWFDHYHAILKDHTGEELVYLYVGDVEAILTPDNQVLVPLGIDLTNEIVPEEVPEYYHYFKYEQNTYVPE
jgi:hypothetical protein